MSITWRYSEVGNSTHDTPFWNMTKPTNACETFHALPEGEFSLTFAIMFGIPASLIILITVFGNLLVLCFRARVGKRQTTLLIWNLGLADFLVGVIVLPMGVTTVIMRKWMFGRFLCRLWVCSDVVFCTASIVTLCLISLDRYIGVTRPLRYKSLITKRKVVTAMGCVWGCSLTILLATLKYNPNPCIPSDICHVGNELRYVVHSVILAFFLPATVTLALYWKIYKVAEQREMGLQSGMMMMMGENFLKDVVPSQMRMHCGGNVSKQETVIRMHKKVAKTLGVVVTAFLVCWLPFFSCYLISYHCGNCIPALVLDITTWLGYCNSMINPVIYAFTINEFRDNVKRILFVCCPARFKFANLTGTRYQNYSTCYNPSAAVLNRNGTTLMGSVIPRANHAYSVCSQGLLAPNPRRSMVKKRKPVIIAESSPIDASGSKSLTSPTKKEGEISNGNVVSNPMLELSRDKNSSLKRHLNEGDSITAKVYCTLISSKETGV